MPDLFNVIFSGEVAGKADPATVRANVGKLFNASEAVLDRLFSGQPVVIKKMVDQATAMQLRARLKLVGANSSMVPVDAEGRPLEAATPPPPTGSMAARVDKLAEQQARAEAAKPKPNAPPPPADVDRVSTWALYPIGALLGAPLVRPAPLVPNISSLSMAAIGAELLAETERQQVKPVQVDISGISMSAPRSDVLNANERRRVVPVQVDITGISMAEVGAVLDEIQEEKTLLNPDISHLSLAE